MLPVIFICLLFAFSLVSGRLEKTIIAAPIVFTLAGILAFPMTDPAIWRMDAGAFLKLAEIGPVLCLIVSGQIGASMFIAALVAGLAVQVGFKGAGKHSVEFAEEWGQVINLSVFFPFGLIISRDHGMFSAGPFVYAVLSLTVVRMLPVAISLVGCGLNKGTIAFMGWFGPRGLASIVLGLVYLEAEIHLPGEHVTRLAVMATVLLSIFAHGLTTSPGIRRLARLGDPPDHKTAG
ncbi:MAG: hypothetical protein K9N23_07820 [Akkermansiaceae bacterium]|nr:hypothetical protein [Akkermansiaceae bacterium]